MPDVFVAKPTKKTVEKKPEIVEKTTPGIVTIQKKELHPFTTFHTFPEGVVFENQEDNETIYLFVRKHFITNLRWVLTSIFLSLLPLFIFLLQQSDIFIFPDIPSSITLILTLFYYVILFGYTLINTVSWFYNIGIVTQLRVIDIDLNNIQNKRVSATVLSDIVDVSYAQKGFLQSLFDYGDVHLQTEGLTENFEFLKIPHPARASDIISDLIAGREVT